MRLFLLILLLSGQILAKRITIDIPFPGGVERVEFDDSKISRAEIQRIFKQLDPNLSSFSGYGLPNALELCPDGDKNYAPCGTRDIRAANFLHNAGVNIQISQQRLQELKKSSFPDELRSVRAYVSASFGSALQVNKCRLEFYKTWDIRILRSCDASEASETCDPIVEALKTAQDQATKYARTYSEWPSCVLHSRDNRLGPYPQDDWNKFLHAYGITEQEITNDD